MGNVVVSETDGPVCEDCRCDPCYCGTAIPTVLEGDGLQTWLDSYSYSQRYLPCPYILCMKARPVDTWLTGTTAAHRTIMGIMHGDCYLEWREWTEHDAGK